MLPLTSTFVTNGPVSKITTLGNGDGNFRFYTGNFGHIGQHNSAQAFRVLSQFLHLSATAAWDRGVWVLRCWCAWNQLHGFIVGRRFWTLSGSICFIQRSDAEEKNESHYAKALNWCFHLWILFYLFFFDASAQSNGTVFYSGFCWLVVVDDSKCIRIWSGY